MTFNPLVPQATDPILQSFFQLRSNFQAINSAFSENHKGLTQDASVSGQHNIVLFQPQLADPTTTAAQIALYTKLVSSTPEIFYRPNSNQTPIQMTYPSLLTDGSAQQYTFVAGPFVIYGGRLDAVVNNQAVVLLPATTLLYVNVVYRSLLNTGNSVIPTNIVGSSFNVTYFPNTASFPAVDIFYFAIGI